MSDPTRLNDLHDEDSAAERELLATSRVDAPPPGARNRALAALGVAGGATLVTLTTVESAHHGLRFTRILKVLGVFGLVAAIGSFAYEKTRPTSVHEARAAAPAMSVPTDTPMSVPTYISPEMLPIAENSAASASPVSAPLKTHAPASSAKPVSADEEIAWIDRAQKALANDPAKARHIVDAYRRDVSPRAYDEEATAIAAEASAKLGDQDRAKREAEAFLATYPTSAYRDRVHAILSGP
jgi:hypothetical protein